MAWVKVKWIKALFDAFNAAFPLRDRRTDGTIGDTAHQGSTSGHNPDDTPGSRAEASDADSTPEVRAADVDVDLLGAGVARSVNKAKMWEVVNRILATPADRNRFLYIIFDGWIWRKRTGWVKERYTGSDPHSDHPHFSGDPAHDENGNPFSSILSFAAREAASMALTEWAFQKPTGYRDDQITQGTVETLPNGQKTAGDTSKGHVGMQQRDTVLALAAEWSWQAANRDVEVTLTPEQLDAFADKVLSGLAAAQELWLEANGGRVAEQAAEAAVRRVLGQLDGAVPPPVQ